ncbi:MAG: dienelactone hydrolase family protein [Verrucomicrobia bacterium]|nr:dienelactone hydrolase family protein [Verrucomicrobiota bacterium]
MKCYLGVCVVLLVSILLTNAEDALAAEQDIDFSKVITKTITGQYILRLPEGYADSEDEWPIMLLLHGAGERGNELHRVKGNWPKILDFRQDFPFIIVAPQCPENEWWQSERALAALEDALSQCRVDMNRVYVSGLSMGGFGTWRVATERADLLAAAAPVCGGGDVRTADKLKGLPIWAFHGDADPVIPIQESQDMVEAVNAAGGHAMLTVYPGVGHDSWVQAYANPSLYLWMLDNAKGDAETDASKEARRFFEQWKAAYDFQRSVGDARVSMELNSDRCILKRRNGSASRVTETVRWDTGEKSNWHVEPAEWTKESEPGEEATAEFAVELTGNSGGMFPLPRIESTVLVDGEPFIKDGYVLPVAEDFFLQHARSIKCRRLATPPAIDGNLEDEVWADCDAASDFVLLDGAARSVYPTEVRVGYDDKALYCSFHCVQKNLDELAVKYHVRDGNLWEDDSVEMFVDRRLDRKNYYHFIANADGFVFDEINRGESWNSECEAVSGRADGAWTLEMVVPWSSLPEGAPKPGDRMGFELVRTHIGGEREVSQWAPTLGDNHTPTRFGLIIFE